MSENAKMDPTTAEAVILEGVYVPAFVEKCASHGVTFRTEDDLRTALETVAALKQAEAAESTNLVKEAHDALFSAAGVENPSSVAERQAAETQANEKAAEVAKNDLVKQALAVLNSKE